MNIAVVGLSHKTAPVEVREKLSIPEPQMESAIAHLSYSHIQVAILSTCNRLEIYIVTPETEQGIREVTQFLSEHSKLPLLGLRQHVYLVAPGCNYAPDASCSWVRAWYWEKGKFWLR